MKGKICPFVRCSCDGGAIYADETIGCGFKADMTAECEWAQADLTGMSPRDFYNKTIMEETKK